jgi:hypothetical protein
MKSMPTVLDTSEPKAVKSNVTRNILLGASGLVLIGLLVITLLGGFSPTSNPIDQFIAKKTCSFLVMDDVSKAVCTDGTVYNVVQIGEPVSPLP